jgi:nicotinic acid mononucleotide adenylyltransferase
MGREHLRHTADDPERWYVQVTTYKLLGRLNGSPHAHADNDTVVSSTKIRLLLKRDLSITYLIPSPVIDYIMENRLYMDDDTKSNKDKQSASK